MERKILGVSVEDWIIGTLIVIALGLSAWAIWGPM